MKIILKDFYYKNNHIKRYECEFPQVSNLEDIPVENLEAYIIEALDQFIEEDI